MKGDTGRPLDSLSIDTKNCLMNVLEKFKEDKLNVQNLSFDDPEIDSTVKAMPKLTTSEIKESKKELKEHMIMIST